MKIRALTIVFLSTSIAFCVVSKINAEELKKEEQQAVISSDVNARVKQPAQAIWNQVDYEAWKKDQQAQWDKAGQTDQWKQTHDLFGNVDRYLKNDPKLALYSYNFIRERAKQSIETKINEHWFNEAWKDVKPIILVESYYEERKLALPTIAQSELVREAQILTNLLDDRAILSRPGAQYGSNYIAAEQTADLDEMIFNIYHELGHIKNNSVRGLMYEKNKAFTPDQKIENFDKDYPKTSAFVKRLNDYIKHAKEKIDGTSETGRIIQEHLAKTTTFWAPPTDPEQYITTVKGRVSEARADLFAVEKLLKQKRSEPVLFTIKNWGTSDYMTVTGNNDVHPSYLERALYIAGFLISKGIDINKELYRWEHFGTCKDVRKLYGPWSRLHTKDMGDFMRVYKANEKERQALEYKLWKSEKVIQLNVLHGGEDLLISSAQWFLAKLQERPEIKIYQKHALFNYNYLRELKHLPMAESFEQIDKPWLNSMCMPADIQGSAKDYCAGCCMQKDKSLVACICRDKNENLGYSTGQIGCKSYSHDNGVLTCEEDEEDYESWKIRRAKQYADFGDKYGNPEELLASDLRLYLDFLFDKDHPDDKQIKRHALFNYNYLRELKHLPTIESVEQIDKMWAQKMIQTIQTTRQIITILDFFSDGMDIVALKQILEMHTFVNPISQTLCNASTKASQMCSRLSTLIERQSDFVNLDRIKAWARARTVLKTSAVSRPWRTGKMSGVAQVV